MSRDASLAQTDRVNIETPDLTGSINLKGARFDDLKLKNYHLTVDPTSPIIELLSPANLTNGYIAEFGFVGNETSGTVPGPDTVWTTESGTLTPESPAILKWVNDRGVEFTRTISVDEHYMFTVEDSIANVIDYDHLIAGIEAIVESGHINLVETLADLIGDFCMADRRVTRARIKVEKLDALAQAASAGIEIERHASLS